jgi:hypothetical protein
MVVTIGNFALSSLENIIRTWEDNIKIGIKETEFEGVE